MNQMGSSYLALVVAVVFGVTYISIILTFVLGELMKANHLKKIELKHRGISKELIEGK